MLVGNNTVVLTHHAQSTTIAEIFIFTINLDISKYYFFIIWDSQ